MKIGNIKFNSKAILIFIMLIILIAAVLYKCASSPDGDNVEGDQIKNNYTQDENPNSDGNEDAAKPADSDVSGNPESDKPNKEDGDSDSSLANEENDAESEAYTVFDGALFIGDSRTEGMKLYSGIDNAYFFCAKSMSIDKVVEGNDVNVGGNSVSIYDVLNKNIFSKVYISLGLNELGWASIDRFNEEYEKLIDEIQARQPDAKVYIQLIFPVSQEKSDSHKTVNNARIFWYNTNLINIATEKGVTYLNADAPLVDENGALKDDATTDGVHINRDYCIKWAEYLANLTKKDMGNK